MIVATIDTQHGFAFTAIVEPTATGWRAVVAEDDLRTEGDYRELSASCDTQAEAVEAARSLLLRLLEREA